MARIYIKIPKSEPIYVSNERARPIAIDKKKLELKEIENFWVDVENFHGYLSDIRLVLLDEEPKNNYKPEPIVPLTEEERKKNKEAMDRVRKSVFGK